MSQADYDIANQAGAAFRAELNDHLAAIVSNNSGATEPSTKFAYQWWADTTTGLLKIRNAANSAWVTVGTLASAYLGAVRNTGNETIAGNKTFSGVTAIGGTSTNDNAAAGYVGEYLDAELVSPSAVSLVTDTPKTVISLALTPGDWDVDAFGGFLFPASTSFVALEVAISTVTNALGGGSTVHRGTAYVPGADNVIRYPSPTKRISILSTTTVYLVVNAVFAVSTLKAFGYLRARRIR